MGRVDVVEGVRGVAAVLTGSVVKREILLYREEEPVVVGADERIDDVAGVAAVVGRRVEDAERVAGVAVLTSVLALDTPGAYSDSSPAAE